MDPSALWSRFQQYLCAVPSIGLSLDISRMHFDQAYLDSKQTEMNRAYEAMEQLERGAKSNVDEGRMVGHYWLRSPELAPSPEIRKEIVDTVTRVLDFAAKVHARQIKPPTANRFTQVLAIGIGGSALGPMFVSDALGSPRTDRMQVHFIDNTDPDGIARILTVLENSLAETLCIVTSKSGGTPETRNGMLVVAEAYRLACLKFSDHAVAITMPGSRLDEYANQEKWIARFPMFDWIGGRTSELSAVGLLPAALQGLDIRAMLEGAAACDAATRTRDTPRNQAALLALMWHCAGAGRGSKDMVIVPYKDRLLLFSRYLQQLVMESLGKGTDLDRKAIAGGQGLSVYGNKGSTDQHAYIQQLRDGINNFFVVFVRVLDSGGNSFEVEPGVTAGDYLHGFLLGTREALYSNQRQSMTITVNRIDARTVGALIALFERAVGLYASLININAYNQPGVEAGKKAAAAVLDLQAKVVDALSATPHTAEQIAAASGAPEKAEDVFWILEHLAANDRARRKTGNSPADTAFMR